MRFIHEINKLKESYDSQVCGIRDNAFLLGKFKKTPPLAEHMVFFPMPHKVKEHLVTSYKRAFPRELLELYDTMNGANLFWSSLFIEKAGIYIPIRYLSIYGVPLTYDRMHIEPFNISIEDLNRPQLTPSNWLKFGDYSTPSSGNTRWDLFVDVDSGCVFSVEHGIKDCTVSENWNSIDESLCDIYDLLNSCNIYPK